MEFIPVMLKPTGVKHLRVAGRSFAIAQDDRTTQDDRKSWR